MSRRKPPDRLPCPCGSTRPPVPMVDRAVRKARMWRVACPDCHLTTKHSRSDLINAAWNDAVRTELHRRHQMVRHA